MSFNQYGFLADLQEQVNDKIENGEFSEFYNLQEFVSEETSTACIYYSDCFDIIKALNFTEFTDSDMEIRNVSDAAYCALAEFCQEQLPWSYYEQLIDKANV